MEVEDQIERQFLVCFDNGEGILQLKFYLLSIFLLFVLFSKFLMTFHDNCYESQFKNQRARLYDQYFSILDANDNSFNSGNPIWH